MSETGFDLDPARFPKTLELTLSAELEAQLRQRAESSGRCLDELIVELLDQALQSNPRAND